MFGNLFGSAPVITRTIKLHNTESGQLEDFEPYKASDVKMYSCGPTVYDYAHIGNMRSYVFADILKRTLIRPRDHPNVTTTIGLRNDGDEPGFVPG